MSTPARIGGFVLGLMVVFAAAVGIGSALGPLGSTGTPSEQHSTGHTP